MKRQVCVKNGDELPTADPVATASEWNTCIWVFRRDAMHSHSLHDTSSNPCVGHVEQDTPITSGSIYYGRLSNGDVPM